MVETASRMLPLGTIAPDFKLKDVGSNKMISLHDFPLHQAIVVMFLCNHCPYVKHIHKKLLEVVKFYQERDINFIAICSNDAKKYPQDSPEAMRKQAETYHYTFPYLYDENQEAARAYQAVCTPDFYVFDKNLSCIYRGRFDNATPGNKSPVTGADLCNALDNLLMGKPINSDQKPSLGCNIKWK